MLFAFPNPWFLLERINSTEGNFSLIILTVLSEKLLSIIIISV